MRGFTIALLLIISLATASAFEANPIRMMISEKARLSKTNLKGEEEIPVLKAHGNGITDGQESLVLNLIDQAERIHGSDIYKNANFIQ